MKVIAGVVCAALLIVALAFSPSFSADVKAGAGKEENAEFTSLEDVADFFEFLKGGSGKTTILRDLIRQVSNGALGKNMRIAVIDSRGEISGINRNTPLELGVNTDVLYTENKANGVEIAVRTMFPDIVAFDEIGSTAELDAVRQSFNSGVNIYTTAHIGSISELSVRPVVKELLKSGAINHIALLPKLHGGDIKFLTAKELNFELAV